MTNLMTKLLCISILLSIHAITLAADFDDCRQMFPNGKPPTGTDSGMKPRALCYKSFAVLHSGVSKTPIYVAERINRASVSPEIERGTRFFADARLPRSERAELEDYAHSGYDRGHQAPAGDMPDQESMTQCFTLANMVPQAPIHNRKTWSGIERATRDYAKRAQGDIFVITGPVFTRPAPTIGPGKVWVPAVLFKLVYDPQVNKSWAYWIENKDDAKVGKPISYSELRQRTGIDFLPAEK